MQEEEMEYSYGGYNEREEEVEGEEAGKGCIVNRKSASNSLDECSANIGNGR